MSTSYKVITPPTQEPVTLDYAKSLLRVTWPDDDFVISNLISQARSLAETITHRSFATQTIQQIETIERPIGGDLSGSIRQGANWYQFQEQLGADPFGPSQFYFSLCAPPIQASTPVTIETRVTAFAPWQTFSQYTNLDGSTNTYLDNNLEPARLYVQDPLTANFYRFTYVAGYSASYPLPPDLMQCLLDLVMFLYDNRDGQDIPDSIKQRLLARRVDWV